MSEHLVYPAGPPCAVECPGDWSQYHDGYAWGYESATTAASAIVERVRDEVRPQKLGTIGQAYFAGHDDACTAILEALGG